VIREIMGALASISHGGEGGNFLLHAALTGTAASASLHGKILRPRSGA
jgi:hypothetical protein